MVLFVGIVAGIGTLIWEFVVLVVLVLVLLVVVLVVSVVGEVVEYFFYCRLKV